jgi:uncharacterized protein
MRQVPLVDYLVLGDDPHLVANECVSCGARYFDRRNACASCSSTEFVKVPISPRGTLRSYSIISVAAPGIEVPFIAGVVDCEGTTVRGNVINVAPDPEALRLGMELALATVPIGTDSTDTEAVGFGFEPCENGAPHGR